MTHLYVLDSTDCYIDQHVRFDTLKTLTICYNTVLKFVLFVNFN